MRCSPRSREGINSSHGAKSSPLVVLAEDLKTQLILTTDRRDFGIYRIDGKKKVMIRP